MADDHPAGPEVSQDFVDFRLGGYVILPVPEWALGVVNQLQPEALIDILELPARILEVDAAVDKDDIVDLDHAIFLKKPFSICLIEIVDIGECGFRIISLPDVAEDAVPEV
jgi:hypothetical protein